MRTHINTQSEMLLITLPMAQLLLVLVTT